MKKIQVHVIEARSLLPTDLNGYSDPYSIVYYEFNEKETKLGKSPSLDRTLNPEWNYNVQKIMDVDYNASIIIKIFDHDAANFDDNLGNVKIPLLNYNDGLWTDKWYRLYDEKFENEVRGYVRVRVQVTSPEIDCFRFDDSRPGDTEVFPKRLDLIKIQGDEAIVVPRPVPIS